MNLLSLLSLLFSVQSSFNWNKTCTPLCRRVGEEADFEREGLQAACWVPLISRAQVLGVLGLSRLYAIPFSPDDVSFLMQVANQVAIAVENALAYGEITVSPQISHGRIDRCRGFHKFKYTLQRRAVPTTSSKFALVRISFSTKSVRFHWNYNRSSFVFSGSASSFA